MFLNFVKENMLLNFMKYISGAQVNHIVNEDLNGEFAGFKTIILCCVHSI